MTEPELMPWASLQGKPFGYHFRRQVPIGPYVADFVCLKEPLIIEVDGDDHVDEQDVKRDGWFAQRGFRTLRIDAAEVYADVGQVIGWILAEIEHPSSA